MGPGSSIDCVQLKSVAVLVVTLLLNHSDNQNKENVLRAMRAARKTSFNFKEDAESLNEDVDASFLHTEGEREPSDKDDDLIEGIVLTYLDLYELESTEF